MAFRVAEMRGCPRFTATGKPASCSISVMTVTFRRGSRCRVSLSELTSAARVNGVMRHLKRTQRAPSTVRFRRYSMESHWTTRLVPLIDSVSTACLTLGRLKNGVCDLENTASLLTQLAHVRFLLGAAGEISRTKRDKAWAWYRPAPRGVAFF